MDDIEDLSAYLDGEIAGPDLTRIEDAAADDPEAATRLRALRSARDAVAAVEAAPTEDELAGLDAVVLAHLARPAAPPSATGARRRRSPRSQGRPAWPYFAAAAGIAVVLSMGLALLAQTFGGKVTSTDVAEAPRQPTSTGPGTESTPPTDPSAAGVASDAAPQAEAPAYGPRAGAPRLFLSEVTVTDVAELGGLLAAASPVPADREYAIDQLADLATAAGAPDLGSCLRRLPADLVPSRVDSGSLGGEAAWFVAAGPPGGEAAVLYALAPLTCELLGRYPPP